MVSIIVTKYTQVTQVTVLYRERNIQFVRDLTMVSFSNMVPGGGILINGLGHEQAFCISTTCFVCIIRILSV